MELRYPFKKTSTNERTDQKNAPSGNPNTTKTNTGGESVTIATAGQTTKDRHRMGQNNEFQASSLVESFKYFFTEALLTTNVDLL